MTGHVYKSTGSWYSVKTLSGKRYDCRIKGTFRTQNIKSTNPIAVGDFVDFELETKNNTVSGIIHKIHNRKNSIVRKSVNLSKQIHVIASNIDYAFLIITIDNPPTFTNFIDRFLVSAQAYDIQTILLFNKIDTYDADGISEVQRLMGLYQKIGYHCIEISAKTGTNITSIKTLMHGCVSLFSGHSGVGKSTLINTLEPTLNLKTKALSTTHMQGQHMTTFAEMFDTSFGAKIIDSPGIKGFGLVDIGKAEMGDYFPEIFKLKQACKFNNCIHVKEPQCAVRKAVETGTIAPSRYQNYLQLLEEERTHYRTDHWQH